ncbi:sensor histidine kinase, partial [bacterium]|nr:sensor histidine kinase [bacterium]
MKLKGRPGASLVLLFTLTSTVGLFFYGDRLKNESYQNLRNQLGTLELQNVAKEKNRQVMEAAQAAARRLDKFIDQAKSQTETMADTKELRRSHTKAGSRKAKKRAFLKAIKARTNWSSGLLTDERGRKLASMGKKPDASIAATPAFKLASRQRLTAMVLEVTAPDKVHLKITVPCLTDHGNFLGVLQATISITSESYQPHSSPGGILVLIGTSQGRRLTPGPQKNFPDDLGVLFGKRLPTMQELSRHPAEGPEYFKVRWEDTEYLIGSASFQLTKNKLFALLEITGLEKIIGPPAVSTSLFSDPLILGGLALILLLGMVFMILFSGGSSAGIKKINQALDGMRHEGENLVPLALSGSGEVEKLTDAINFLINKANKTKGPAPAGRIETDETENLTHLNRELMELRQAHDQALAKNMELEEKAEELVSQNRELKQVVPSPDNTGQHEELVAKYEAAGRIRSKAINSMSEDLKAMLLVIKNYISRILSSEEGKITDKQQDFLGEVINKSARLERLISDLLDIAYLEGESAQIVLTSTDIAALLEDVVLNIQAQADSKQIQLIQEMPPSLTPVMVNSERMGRVFV